MLLLRSRRRDLLRFGGFRRSNSRKPRLCGVFLCLLRSQLRRYFLRRDVRVRNVRSRLRRKKCLALTALATARPPEDWKVSLKQFESPALCGAFLCLLRTAIAALLFTARRSRTNVRSRHRRKKRLALTALATARPPEDWKVSLKQSRKPRSMRGFFMPAAHRDCGVAFYGETFAYGSYAHAIDVKSALHSPALATARPPEDWKVSLKQSRKPRSMRGFFMPAAHRDCGVAFYGETFAYGRTLTPST